MVSITLPTSAASLLSTVVAGATTLHTTATTHIAKSTEVADAQGANSTAYSHSSNADDSGLTIELPEFQDCDNDPKVVVTPALSMLYSVLNTLEDPSDGSEDSNNDYRVWGSYTLSRGMSDCETLTFFAPNDSGEQCANAVDYNRGPVDAGCFPLSGSPQCVMLELVC